MRIDAEVAQVVEHGTENAGVASSTLALGTPRTIRNNRTTSSALASGSGSVVEHLLAKVRAVQASEPQLGKDRKG